MSNATCFREHHDTHLPAQSIEVKVDSFIHHGVEVKLVAGKQTDRKELDWLDHSFPMSASEQITRMKYCMKVMKPPDLSYTINTKPLVNRKVFSPKIVYRLYNVKLFCTYSIRDKLLTYYDHPAKAKHTYAPSKLLQELLQWLSRPDMKRIFYNKRTILLFSTRITRHLLYILTLYLHMPQDL